MKDYNELKYFDHYARHTYLVVLAWKGIQNRLIESGIISENEFFRINFLILHHDESKLLQDEWVPYARYFEPVGSVDKERSKNDFKKAVKQHKKRNLHHFESLRSYEGSDWKCYIIEMICDYIAMGWELGHYFFEYYDNHKGEIDLPDNYQSFLDEVLIILRKPDMAYINESLDSKMESILCFK